MMKPEGSLLSVCIRRSWLRKNALTRKRFNVLESNIRIVVSDPKKDNI